MRLLKRNHHGELSLTGDLAENEVPKYAILSHTWRDSEEEVTYEDFTKGLGKGKAGYKKIEFCGEQAARDEMTYFWVDTCCIDKSNHNELPDAISSMFDWYRNAARCYVYLSDVPARLAEGDVQLGSQSWNKAFQESRWFRRGWTLQELLAPAFVDFFSKDCKKLGNKQSLEEHICKATGIAPNALQGTPLFHFTLGERWSWMENRKTKYEEDSAYSLLGIFGVQILPSYGEGKEVAITRLNEQIEQDLNDPQFMEFCVPFGISDVSGVEHFVARDGELIRMHKTLRGDGRRRAVVLHGLGGMGKTQLAITYAKRYRHSYSAVFWLNAKDEESLMQSFAKAARRILQEHPSANRLSSIDLQNDKDKTVDAVNGWLSLAKNTRWLLIYDNYDDPKAFDIQRFLPQSYQGSVVITTRSFDVDGALIHVRKLESTHDGLRILSNASKREIMDDPNAVLLAKELDGLPLALATAGAYLEQVATSLLEYLHLYKASWAKLQESSPEIRSYKDRTLYSTWQISYKRIKQQNDLSAKLLQLWAYFDNQDIWFELLRHSNFNDPLWIQELTEDETRFTKAIRVLCNHGLVEVDNSSQESVESRGYSIHSCVHQWTIHVLNREWNPDLAKLALKFIGSHVPANDTDRWWVTQLRLLQHATRGSCVNLADEAAEEELHWAFNSLGILYRDQGKLDEAETIYLRALQGYEKTLGPEHTSTLDTVNNLGILYRGQGKLEEAETMYLRALQGTEKALGPEHMSTLDTVNNLGNLYGDQGKLDEAETMYLRALQGYKKVLGPEQFKVHLHTLNTMENYSNLLMEKGSLEKAEE